MTFDELVDEVAEQLNLTAPDAIARVGRDINRRYKRVTTAVGMITTRRATVPFTVTPGTRDQVVNGEKVISVKLAGAVRPMDAISYSEMQSVVPTTGSPTLWSVKRQNATTVTLQFNATMDDGATMSIEVEEAGSTLSGAMVPVFPESYHDVLWMGALADGLAKKDKTVAARDAEAAYKERLNELVYHIAVNGYQDIQQGKNNLSRVTASAASFPSGSVAADFSFEDDNENILIGQSTGLNFDASATDNVIIGPFAGRAGVSVKHCTFIGDRAGLNNLVDHNVFIGSTTGQSNTTGQFNTFVGRCGNANTTGQNNTFVGYTAGNANIDGADNTFIGVNAGTSNTSGFGNTVMGSGAMLLNTTGTGNTVVGNAAGAGCITGSFSCYYGKFSGWVETGSANAYFGYKSGQASTAGDRNTLMGNSAGFDLTTGDDNTFLGYNSGDNITTGSQNTMLGNGTIGAAGIINAIAIGYQASVGATRCIAIGAGVVNPLGDTVAIGDANLLGVQFGGTVGASMSLGSGGLNVHAKGGATPGIYCASTSAVADASDVGGFEFGSTGTAASDKRAAAIHGFLKGSAATNVTGQLVFYVGIASVLTESFRCNETGEVVLQAGTATRAPIRFPHGVAPTFPVDGDMWTTTAGAFIRINGVTKTFTLV